MKSVKVYLIIVSLLLLIALGFAVYVWITLQDLRSQSEPVPTETATERETASQAASSENTQGVTEPVTIREEQLSPAQKQLLESFGIDTSEITITPEMIACAEAEVGTERFDEILDGATPGPLESLTLLGCFRK